jgi:hypothetical protein
MRRVPSTGELKEEQLSYSIRLQPPSARQRLLHRLWLVRNYLKICPRRSIRLASSLLPILQRSRI